MADTARQWQRINPTTSTKTGWRTLVEKTFVMGNGQTKSFTTINPEGTECAGCIALTPDNMVIVARQYRVGPEIVMNEIPGGFVDLNEDRETAARRELAEETGYVPGEFVYMGKVCNDGYTNVVHHYYFATNCMPSAQGPHQETSEDIQIMLLPIAEFLQGAMSAQTTDVGAVLLAYDRLKALT